MHGGPTPGGAHQNTVHRTSQVARPPEAAQGLGQAGGRAGEVARRLEDALSERPTIG